jgi:hypothetical protein
MPEGLTWPLPLDGSTATPPADAEGEGEGEAAWAGAPGSSPLHTARNEVRNITHRRIRAEYVRTVNA